jgi:hypothetical protein
MNESYLQPEIKERFQELPETVQNIILESGWEKTTRRIVEDNNLRIDQGAAIENEVMLTMFGFERPENFKENIIKETDLTPEEADKVVADINQNVFQLIKDRLVLETDDSDDNFEETDPNTTITSELKREGVEYQNNEDTVSLETEIESKEDILSEIEKPEPEINQQDRNSMIEENLSKPSVKQPETQKIDPYREPVE